MSRWMLQAMSSLASLSDGQQDPPQVTRNDHDHDHGERVEYCSVQSTKMLGEMEQSCKEIVCPAFAHTLRCRYSAASSDVDADGFCRITTPYFLVRRNTSKICGFS